jgi:hypothetical protein
MRLKYALPAQVKGSWKRAPGSHKMPAWLQKANGIREAAQRLKNTVADTAGHADKVGAFRCTMIIEWR